ncbi:uncharacterized protein LOC116394276 [Anarrhichthys ocellatus]|uniref:uncharacterized protein LOC116394276 n=1 Tax=Anarrhichthys ocellatus TaxID=433405 RepID=UPI0012ED43E4|nr:uncharacterized protein LOC116394276 [Anarrhichthys ocellatus]
MAFANLFTGLAAVEEGVKSPGPPAFTHRNETGSGQRGNARKRKIQVEHTGPYKKKQCHEVQTTRNSNGASFREDDSKAIHYNIYNTDSRHASAGFTKEVIHNHSYKPDHNNKGQNYTTKNNRNVNKQQKNKPEWPKNHHQQKDRWRPANRGGSHQTQPTWGQGGRYRQNRNDKQGVQVKRPKLMSQEFKDQNGVLVDGRLICRHFLWGRCIKEDDCQLEHVKGYNNLVKEVCKYYVQGVCTKEESCPYMHKSFPCKFFHRKGKCSQGADCKFSHEPLNDVTNQLLHEVFKRDDDLYALSKKAEQESSGQPENTDEPEITEASRTSDTLLQPLRPIFYNSGETNAEKDCRTKELADIMEEAVPPNASDAAQPHLPPSSDLKHEEPVCYSVAAVLGPQLFKPFPSFFTTPGSHESGSSVSANQSKVPYSVDAVLRSCKSVEYSTFRHSPTPPTAQTVSYTPKTDFEEFTEPMLSSETQDEKVLRSVNTRNGVNNSQEKLFKSLSSLQVHTSVLSKNCPSLTLASRDNKTRGGNMPESMKPAQRPAHEVKLEFLQSPVTVAEKSVLSKGDMKRCMCLPLDITCSDTCKSEGVLPFGRTNRKSIFSRPSSQKSTSKCPTELRPHLSVLTSDSQASTKPFSPSGFTDFIVGAAVPVKPVTSSFKTSASENSGSRHFVEKQPTEIHLHSKKTQSVLNHDTPYSTAIIAECSSKTAHCGDLAVGCKKTLKRPFHSLFASPITDSVMQPKDDSGPDSPCPQGFIHSSCPAPQPAGCRSNRVQSAVEPDKAPARSFLGLFAAPPSAAPLPCIQSQPDYSRPSSCSQQSNQSVDNTFPLSNSKPRASDLETPLQHQLRTVKEISCATRSSYFSPNPKIENEDSSTEHINKPTKQLLNPVSSFDSLCEVSTSITPCGNSPSRTHAHQQLPDITSHKVADTANSVLKTLFLCLSPYQQDEEQQDRFQIGVTSDSRLPVHPSTEKTVAHSTEHRPSLQTLQIPLEATVGSTPSSPGTNELQVRNSGAHNMPCKQVASLMQHHTRPRPKRASEEVLWVNRDVVVTPLKDLFKTLETTVFHFGH